MPIARPKMVDCINSEDFLHIEEQDMVYILTMKAHKDQKTGRYFNLLHGYVSGETYKISFPKVEPKQHY